MPYVIPTPVVDNSSTVDAALPNAHSTALGMATQGLYYLQEHGALGNGTADDSPALSATDNANGGNGITEIMPPPTAYRISINTTVNHPIRIYPGLPAFSIDAGITLTLASPEVMAGPYQIATGAGTLVVTNAPIQYSQWWTGGAPGIVYKNPFSTVFSGLESNGNPYAETWDAAGSNLVLNPSFEVNVTDGGWTAGAGYTIQRSTAQAYAGSASMEVFKNTVGGGIASVSNTIDATITTNSAHGLTGIVLLIIRDTVGLTGLNGVWGAIVTSTTAFTLNNTAAFTGTYSAGTGTVSPIGAAGDVLFTSGPMNVSPSTSYALSLRHVARFTSAGDPWIVDVIPNVSAMQSSQIVYDGTSGIPGDWLEETLAFVTGASDSSITLRVRLAIADVVDSYIDAVQVEPGVDASTYIDGSLGAGYAWTGTPNNSSSTRTTGHRLSGQLGTVPTTISPSSYRDWRGEIHQGRTFIGNRSRRDLYGLMNIQGDYDPNLINGTRAGAIGMAGLYSYMLYRSATAVTTPLEGFDMTSATDPSSSAHFSLVQATASNVGHFGTGILDAARGLTSQVQLWSGSGTITDAAGMYIYEPAWASYSIPGPSAITNLYGLYLASQNFASANIYQIYSRWPTITNSAVVSGNLAVLYVPTEGVALGAAAASSTNFYGVFIGQPSLSAAAARTISGNVAGLYVAGPPVAGADVTFTQPAYSVYVASGTSRFTRVNLFRDTTAATDLLYVDHGGLINSGYAVRVSGNVAAAGVYNSVDLALQPNYTASITGAGYAVGLQHLPSVAASVAVAGVFGLQLLAPTLGAGASVATYIGTYVQGMASATTNYALYIVGGQTLVGGPLQYGSTTPTYSATVALTTTQVMTILYEITTTSAVGNATITASTGGTEGQLLVIRINNDATAARTITFGTNFRSSGTVTGTVSLSITVVFISNGTAWVEMSRSAAA